MPTMWTVPTRAIALSCLSVGLAGPALAISGPFEQTYQGRQLVLSNLVGRVEIEVGGSNISVSITGRPEELSAITVAGAGQGVRIESSLHRRRINDDAEDYAVFKINVPRGSDLTIDGLVGEAQVGDIGGRLILAAGAVDADIGAVSAAEIALNGSGDIRLGEVGGALSIEIQGSGDVAAHGADSADVAIAGSGDVAIGDVRHGLSAKIAGSGDIAVASVDGPVSAELAGSGDVSIKRGRANPLRVSIVGSGDFSFGGEAVDPDISIMGSGGVRIGSYSGKLTKRGTGDLTVGK
jgi:hypothetical protein